MEEENKPLGVFKRLVAAVRQHHEAGNGIHTELLQEADDLLKSIEEAPHELVDEIEKEIPAPGAHGDE
ncbi:MAG: hypothetical protein ABSF90_03545 [Syntrophobacteraceae bacterium]|jgi:hypothetical protein